MFNHSLPSIEQFAAYLDGNLSESETQQFSQLAENDGVLHQLLDASAEVDDTIADFADSDLQLPTEIISSDFEIPTIPSEGVSSLVTLSLEPMDDIVDVIDACTNEDVLLLSDEDSEYHSTMGGELHDNSLYLTQEDDCIESNDDFSGIQSDEFLS